MRIINGAYCGECCFFKNEDMYGVGSCILKGYENMHCTDQCDLDYTKISKDATIKGVSAFQKWRRGGKSAMPRPYVVGVLLDAAIHYLRGSKQ